jgi:pimeloyl-ACP methyl ester carboxylesterase
MTDHDLGDGFTGATQDLTGTSIHYLRGGSGPPLVLLHGFPQDWREWRRVLPRLAERFTVLAVDLPGVGGSAPPARGYASIDLARHVHELVEHLELGPVHLAGHDIGGAVAYAYAREFPGGTRSVAVLEVPVPGIAPELTERLDQPLWHVPFHMTPGLPETLVSGRQQAYFRYFFDAFTADPAAVSDADVARYAQSYRDGERLHAGFEYFRALPASAEYHLGRTEPIDVPLLLVGGEHLFGPIMPALAERLRAEHGWSDVRVEVVAGAMHYLPEERPDEVAGLLLRFALVSGE